MKKVLAIAPYSYLPFYSGGQKFIAQFFEWLGREVDLTVISVAANDFSLAGSYKTVPLLKPSFSRYVDWSLVKKITALVQQEKFDTLICEHPYLAWLCFRVRKRTGIKIILHTHNIEYQRFRSTGKWWWPVLKAYEKRSFKKADGIYFITPEDRAFAINKWHIPSYKCIDLPFGITISKYPTDREVCRLAIVQRHGIDANENILLFNGLLNYKPNIDALKVIAEKIGPLLSSKNNFPYRIIICGKNLPVELEALINKTAGHIIFAGFVEDISEYLKAADIFLNPVLSGGGVKTKMVEAIAYGTTVIATQTGAAGIDSTACGEKLIVTKDSDWDSFTNEIVAHASDQKETPAIYYDRYYWGNIIRHILAVDLNK